MSSVLYYFVILMIERRFILNGRIRIPKPLAHLLTMMAVIFSWSIFYFTESARFATFMGRLFAPGLAGFADGEAGILWKQHLFFLIIAFIGATPILPWLKTRFSRPLRQLEASPLGGILQPLATAFLLFICTASLAASSYNPFLYYRF